MDEAVAAHQWLNDTFEPVIRRFELMRKRDPAQIFHEVLDTRVSVGAWPRGRWPTPPLATSGTC